MQAFVEATFFVEAAHCVAQAAHNQGVNSQCTAVESSFVASAANKGATSWIFGVVTTKQICTKLPTSYACIYTASPISHLAAGNRNPTDHRISNQTTDQTGKMAQFLIGIDTSRRSCESMD
jgi:hypothetical protein